MSTRFHAFKRRFRRLIKAEYCSVYVPWIPSRQRHLMQYIHRAASRHQFPRVGGVERFFGKLFHLSIWPVQAAVLALRKSRQFAHAVTQRTGKSRLRQALEQYAFALLYFLPPEAYYRYGLYQPNTPYHPLDYLHNHEWASLGTYLNDPDCEAALVNKQRFATTCEAHQLPTVPTLVYTTPAHPLETLPAQDLFIKPAHGSRGRGTARFTFRSNGFYSRQDGVSFSAPALMHLLNRRAKHKALLVQPCITNHPLLADLSRAGLSTVRMLTGQWPDGHVELIVATLKMPLDDEITSTFGIDSDVDLATGHLGRAYRNIPTDAGCDDHPSTDGRIKGRVVPEWDEAVELVTRAHAAFSGCVLIGWDVVLTPSGPVLLEGNSGWGVRTIQQPQRRPLGSTRIVPLLLAHLKA